MSSLISAALCGLKDGLNPCLFTTVAFLLYFSSELKKRGFDARWYAALFISVSFVSMLSFSPGALMPYLYSDRFFFLAGKFYLAAGIALCVLGAFHLRGWWRIRQNRGSMDLSADHDNRIFRKSPAMMLMILFSAVLLSSVSTIWPMDRYITFLANFFPIPGKRLETYITLFVYNFVLVLPLIGSYVFASSDFFAQMVRKAPSMVKVVLSAFSLAIGCGLIYIFR